MKTISVRFFIVLFLSISIFGIAQRDSLPVRKLNGKQYRVYSVQPGEGLYAVGRKFQVSVDELLQANPDAKAGLKSGQEVLIPLVQNGSVFKKEATIQHTVQKNQTLFAISKRYNVSQEEIIRLNPSAPAGLREGMVLTIPKATSSTSAQTTDKPETKTTAQIQNHTKVPAKSATFVHVVQADETLYSICRKYQVSVDEVITLNPAYAKRLTIGANLLIPSSTASNAVSVGRDEKQTDAEVAGFAAEKRVVVNSQATTAKTFKIAYLLPFMLNQSKSDASIERFLDFYAGSLLAINEAKKKGNSIEVYAFDTENSDTKLVEVLDNPVLKSVDLIVGPAFTSQVHLISEFATENKIYTLIPFSSKVSDIDDNPYLFQFNPGSEMELQYAIQSFTGKLKNIHIVFADITGISAGDEGRIWSERLKTELKKANKPFVSLKLTTSDDADFSNLLQYYEKNLIIFNTDKIAYIEPYIASVRSMESNFNVAIYQQYGWRNQADKLPKGLCFSPFKTIYDPTRFESFNREFTHYFGRNSGKNTPRYDLLGYDLTSYFTQLLETYGTRFTENIGSFGFKNGIQSQPLFQRKANGSGFVNQQLYILQD